MLIQEGSVQKETQEQQSQQNQTAVPSGEGSASVEKAEQQILGQRNYQKFEVLHRFANNHPVIFYSSIILVLAIVVYLITRVAKKFKR